MMHIAKQVAVFIHHYNHTGAGSCAQAGTTHRSMSLMNKKETEK